MLNISRKLNDYPFPFVVIDDFISESLVDDLDREFPENRLSDSYGVLANRKRLSSDKIDGNLTPAWDSFLCELRSDKFMKSLVEIYNNHMKSSETLDDMWLYFDLSLAGNGYKREIHRDNDNRVINFIFHINDFVGDGGDLKIYSSDISTKHRRQNPENVKLFETIPHKKNRMILFISTVDSYHSLSEIKNCTAPRKFIYGSLTRRK